MLYFLKDQYLSCHLNSFCNLLSSSDMPLDDIRSILENMSKYEQNSEKPIVEDQFYVKLQFFC